MLHRPGRRRSIGSNARRPHYASDGDYFQSASSPDASADAASVGFAIRAANPTWQQSSKDGGRAVTAVLEIRDERTAQPDVDIHGGYLSADELMRALRPRLSQPISAIARWIVRREVLSVERQGRLMLPSFQFSRPALEPLPVIRLVLEELSDVLDDAELASWFYRSNDWLDGCTPACVIRSRAEAVHRAARADRWAMRG